MTSDPFRFAALKAVDTTEMDTFSMNWFMFGNVGIDGYSESPTYLEKVVTNPSRFTEPGDGVVLFYWAGDKEGAKSYAPDMNVHGGKHDGWRPINVKPDGTTDIPDEVKAICNAAWTSTIKDAWKAKLIADKTPS